MLEQKRSVSVPDLSESPWNNHRLARNGYQSALLVPIYLKDKYFAHINMASKQVGAFSRSHEEFLDSISGHLGPAILNANSHQETEKRASRLAVLNEVNQNIAGNLTLTEVLESIVTAAAKLLHADTSYIYLLDPQNNKLILRNWSGHTSPPTYREISQNEHNSLARRVASTGKGLNLSNIQDEIDCLESDWISRNELHSYLALPLQQGDKIIGIINCFSKGRDFFNNEDFNLLGSLSSQASIAIKNAALYEESESKGKRLAALVDVTQQFTRGLDLNSALRSIAEAASKVFGGGAILFLPDADSTGVQTAATSGLPENQHEQMVISGKVYADRVYESGKPYVGPYDSTEDNVHHHKEAKIVDNPIQSILCVPLRFESQTHGALMIFRDNEFSIDEESVRTAMTLANQAVIAIDNGRLHTNVRNSQKYLNTVLETAAYGIITINDSGTIESINKQAEIIFGFTAEEIIGDNVSRLMPEPDKSQHNSYLLRYIQTSQNNIMENSRDVIGLRKNGSLFPMSLAVSEVKLDEGKRFVGIISDISVRVRTEEELAHLNEELAVKNKDLETVFHVASHDLRSPLVNIQGYSKELSYLYEELQTILLSDENIEDLKNKITPLLEKDVPESIQFVLAGASKMDSLLSGLLNYSRLGDAAISLEILDMKHLISDISAAMEYQISKSKITLAIDDLPKCLGDKILTNQIFSNLIDNAIKYSSPDKPGHIHISGSTNDNCSIYCVRDNGIGIPPSQQNKIFQIFHRLDTSFCSGEGLGLTIAQRISNKLNGKIWIESKQNQGSAFYVSLPEK
jgi:two-component system, chemotaxis family, sensor kinase Cph1